MSEFEETGDQTGSVLDQVARVLRVLVRFRWLSLSIIALCTTYVIIQAYQMSDYYRASSLVLLEKIQKKRSEFREVYEVQASDVSYYETQREIVASLPLLRTVADSLGLKEHYGVVSNETATKILQGKVQAAMVRKSRILKITITDGEADWSAKIANTLAESFVKESLRQQFFISEKVMEWFPQVKAVGEQDPMKLLEQVQDDALFEKLPSVINDPVLNRLRHQRVELQSQIRQLISRYTPEHPTVREVSSKLDFIESEILLQKDRIKTNLQTALAGEFKVPNIRVLEEATVPGSPAGPNRRAQIVRGLLVGIALAIGLSMMLDTLDKTIKTDDDIGRTESDDGQG